MDNNSDYIVRHTKPFVIVLYFSETANAHRDKA
jgi:hypothetical protein